MKISILQIGETKEKHIALLEGEFEKRLKAFAQLEIISLEASKSDDPIKAQEEEKKRFLKCLQSKKHPLLIILDERGEDITSLQLAELIGKERDFGAGHLTWVIGGSNGLHKDIIALGARLIRLSSLTFTHEMVRLFLKEQIYRAFTILKGKRYHK